MLEMLFPTAVSKRTGATPAVHPQFGSMFQGFRGVRDVNVNGYISTHKTRHLVPVLP